MGDYMPCSRRSFMDYYDLCKQNNWDIYDVVLNSDKWDVAYLFGGLTI